MFFLFGLSGILHVFWKNHHNYGGGQTISREHTASQKCGTFCMPFFNSQCKGHRFKRPVPFVLPVGGNGKEVNNV